MRQSPIKSVNYSATLLQANPPATLADLELNSWEQLALAIKAKRDGSAGDQHSIGGCSGVGFNTMTVATCTSRGADARTVVLRRVDTVHKYVWFHTDARAEKVLQLEAFPMATLLFWDEEQQIQLRLTVETRLHTDDYIADEHWKTLLVGSRKMYLSEQTPGSEQPQPYPGFPEHLIDTMLSPEESEAGRKNFAVIECRVLAMEYLHLSRNGQTRACFQYEPESKMVWLAP